MKEQLQKDLEAKLNDYMKDNPTKTIAACRETILFYAKKNGVIKDYRYTTNRTSKAQNVFYFGSCVGFDQMYKVII